MEAAAGTPTMPRNAAQRFEMAHHSGAQHAAPYAYFSAKNYLDLAEESRTEGRPHHARRYEAQALEYIDQALRQTMDLPAVETRKPAGNRKACESELERIKHRYNELNPQKAAEVAPALYAQVSVALWRAEYELTQAGRWREAGHVLMRVEPDIDALLAQDSDADSVADLQDGAPWAAEDMDGFEDDDGAPDFDNDADGVLDTLDAAPLQPESKNGWQDHDGVPDAFPILEPLRYPSGSYTLNDSQRGYLRGVAVLLHALPELTLQISGHTDATHSPTYNQRLSKRRAERVQQYLSEHGVSEHRLTTVSLGDSQPAPDGGIAAQRRVELAFK
jgi:outer membrane protein OmpA-like peptidoglycan-associated protein